jgi:hypothetical protein
MAPSGFPVRTRSCPAQGLHPRGSLSVAGGLTAGKRLGGMGGAEMSIWTSP